MNTCSDCKFYLPIDVFKSICKLTRNDILPDDAFCMKAEKLAKCKFCSNYTPDMEFLGKCMSSTLAYPDMNAASCVDFKWISQN